jgi:hypothetical protein
MKRVRRWLVNGLAAFLLLLSALSFGMWMRSHWRSDRIDWGGAWPQTPVPFGTVQWSVISDSGFFCVQHVYSATAKTVIVAGYRRKVAFVSGIAGSENLSDRPFWANRSETSPGFYTATIRQAAVPWWFLCVLFAMASILALRIRIAVKNKSPGRMPGLRLRPARHARPVP